MKVRVRGVRSVRITGDHIKLDSLMKFTSISSTGGEAKYRIQNGEVLVNKEICTLRGKKIRPGDIVRCDDSVILVKKDGC